MKKRLRALVVALCTLALAVTPAFAAWADDENDASSGEMTATKQENEQAKRIINFELDGVYSYESLGTDPGKTTLTLSSSALQKIVKEKLLPQWSPVAASIFRDQAGQLVDLYGYHPDGGNMSQVGFDAYFNVNNGVKEYKDEKWSCYDLRSKLAQTYPSHTGDPGWDQFVVSGVKQVNSLSGARNMVGQTLYDCQGHKGLRADEFLGVTEGPNGETRLDELDSDDQTTGFANLVTSVNCKGSSSDFDYVTFGIVFYDFEPVPVAANKLQYISGKFSSNPIYKPATESQIKNDQQQDIMHSVLLGDSVTETTSTTLSGLASFKMSENIGANIGWSETESESETEFWSDDTFGSGASTSTSSSTTSMGLNWGAAWEMAGALGAEAGHSKSVEVSKAVETTIALPPHTYATVAQASTSTTFTQTYQQPAILNYKVAIFATSGDYYTGGDGGINPSSYDKQSLVIKFDTKDEINPFYGCTATDDLYSRVITNKDVKNYDVSGNRTYSTHSTASGWTKSEDINWVDVMDIASRYYGADVLNNVAKKNFFFESPGKLNVEQDKVTSEAQAIRPLYDLASVRTSKTNYVLYSNNTLDYDALAVQGYNKYGVPFYGFTSDLGEWCRCNEDGSEILNHGDLLPNDPADVSLGKDKLIPKAGTTGGTMYFKWVAKTNSEKPLITGDHPEGQDLTESKIESPVVTVEVINIGLDAPRVTAEGGYTGYYGTPINLNDVIASEVTDKDDKIIDVHVNWESRDLAGAGIDVKTSGYTTFTKPGTYRVRPYVVNNDNGKVYPDWITITATEHDFVHYDAKAPTNCAQGNADGWKEHYRCADCGKYFSEPKDSAEIPESDVIIEALGHDWGEWTASDTPGKEQRVCKNRANHIEYRDVYTVEFNMNDHGTAPQKQTFTSDVRGSVAIPPTPTAAGYTFEGWFTDQECTYAYDFGATVEGNLTLYAKWSPAKYTVATMAIGDVYVDDNGEEKVSLVAHGSLGFQAGTDGVTTVTEDGYTYYYKEVACGDTVTLTATPETNYGLKNIQAVPVNADSSMGKPFEPAKIGTNTDAYSFEMPAADVAVVASFGRTDVRVTYDGNAPEGVTLSGVPKDETIKYGKKPTQLDAVPTITANTTGTTYEFGGWFTDKECTKPFLSTAAATEDMTLFAKWTATPKKTVTYTLLYESDDPNDTGRYTESYKADEGSKAYDPTADIYSVADMDLKAAYELQSVDGSCWFTDEACTKAYGFDTEIADDLNLYAKVVPRQYTVTYFDSEEELGTQEVAYKKAIGTASIKAPTKEGKTLSGWTTKGNAWNIESDPVTSDLKLYADWTTSKYTVTFDANGHGTAPAEQSVTHGSQASNPGDLKADGYTFGGWFTDAACTKAYDFAASVTADLTLYAKWTAEKRTVTFDANGHGTAPAVQTVDYGSKAQKPADPTAEGCTFGGWCTDAACKTAYDFNAPVTANLTLYAKWTVDKRTVTFDANGHGTAPAVQTVDYGSKAQKPTDPTAEGCTFGGWCTDAACKTAYDFNAPVTANLTLYAKWTVEKKEEPEPEPDHRTKTAPATWDRLWGQTALDTMAFIVDEGGFASGGTVVLATFDGYWDALTAAGIAGKLNAPVLMTPAGELSAQTRTALKSLKPSRIVVCGGTAAIPDDIANAAAAVSDAELVRCWGDFAVNTAEDIADKAQALSGEQWADTAFLCTNDGYWDALAAAPISYAKNMPIFLVNGHDTVESSTFDAMRSVGVKNVCLVGGEAAISPAAEQAVRDAGFNVTSRLGGTTAIETSEAVASYGLSLGMTADYMGVATINGYWDALAGAPLCGKRNSVLVLVAGADSHSISGFIKDHDLSIVSAYVFGGKNAIDEATYDAIVAATATVPNGDLSAQGGDLVAASAAGL